MKKKKMRGYSWSWCDHLERNYGWRNCVREKSCDRGCERCEKKRDQIRD